MGSVTMGSNQTLAEVAARYNMTEAQLIEMNPNLKGVKTVPVGQSVNVTGENMGLQVEHSSNDEVEARFNASGSSTMDRLETRGRKVTAEIEQAIDKQIEDFKNMAKAYGDSVYNEMTEDFNAMREMLVSAYEQGEQAYNNAKNLAQVNFRKAVMSAQQAVKDGVKLADKAVDTVVDTAVSAYDATTEFAEETYETAKNTINKGIDTALASYDIATDKLGECYEAAKAELGELYEDVKSGAISMEQAIEKAVTKGLEKASESVDDAGEFISSIPNMAEKGAYIVIGGIAEGIEGAKDLAGRAYDATTEFVEDASEQIQAKLKAAGNFTTETYNKAVAHLKTLGAQVVDRAISFDAAVEAAITKGINDVKEGTMKVVQSGQEVIRTAKKTIDQGVRSGGRTAKNLVKSGFSAIKADVRSANSPSRTSTIRRAKNESTSSYLARKGEALVDDAKNSAKRSWNSAVDTAESGAKTVYKNAKKLWNWITN